MTKRKQTNAAVPRKSAFFLRLTRYFQQLSILLLAVLGFLFSLTTGYGLSLPTARAAWAAVFFCLLFSAVLQMKRKGLALALCFGAATLWTLLNTALLTQGLLLLAEQLLQRMQLVLPDALRAMVRQADAEAAVSLATTGLVALLAAVSLLSAYFVIARPSLLGLALATAPLLLLLPFYSLSPAVTPFFCLAAAFLMLYVYISAGDIPLTDAWKRGTRAGKTQVLLCGEKALSGQRAARRLLSLGVLPAAALAVLLSCLLLPQENYVRPEKIEALRQKILAWDVGALSSLNSNDGLTQGDLRDLSPVRFTGRTALKVKLSEERPLYLRDYSGALYTNDGWTNDYDAIYRRYEPGFYGIAPQNLHAAAAEACLRQGADYTLSVQNVAAASSALWIPKGLTSAADELPGASFLRDALLAGAGVSEYTVSARYCESTLSAVPLAAGASGENAALNAYLASAGSAFGLSEAAGEEAARVRAAAEAYIRCLFEIYTPLPEQTQRAAERLQENYGLALTKNGSALTLFDVCRDVYLTLTERCSYAYEPEPIPSGVDFTTYFLEETQNGYCVHFATAAAVLLRSMGIPARYAEGYIVVSADFEKVRDEAGYIEIEDTHAHAWVEVFDPAQLEWIPIEMTASTDSARGAAVGNADADASPSPSPTPTPTPTPTPSPSPTPTAEPSPTGDAPSPTPEHTDTSTGMEEEPAEPTESPSPDGEPLPDADAPDENGGEPSPGDDAPPEENASGGEADGGGPAAPPVWPFAALLALLLLLAAALGARRLRLRRLTRLFMQPDANAAVLALCRYALSMLRFAGCEALLPACPPETYARAAVKTLPFLEAERLQALIEMAERARFSGRSCTEGERGAALAYLRTLATTLPPHLPRVKRAFFPLRFVYGRTKAQGAVKGRSHSAKSDK